MSRPKSSAPNGRIPARPLFSGPLTIYRQIQAILRDQIASGEYASGEQLPTESQLSAMYQVSRPTVRQALQQLEGEKLVYRERGRGTFINTPERQSRRQRHRLSFDLVDKIGSPIDITFQRKGQLNARGLIQDALQLPRGAEIFYVVHIYSIAGAIVGGAKTHMRAVHGAKLRPTDLVSGSIASTVASRNGLATPRSVKALEAVLAEAHIAGIINAAPGSPLICIRRVSSDGSGVPFECSQFLFKPDKCQFEC